jgi:hypothetical protein
MFGMHTFVKRGQQVKIKFFWSEIGISVDVLDATIDNLIHVLARFWKRRQ